MNCSEIIFPELIFKSPGIYHFTIRELNPSGNGWACDGRVYRVTVTVTDIGDGVLAAQIVYFDGVPIFVNQFCPPLQPPNCEDTCDCYNPFRCEWICKRCCCAPCCSGQYCRKSCCRCQPRCRAPCCCRQCYCKRCRNGNAINKTKGGCPLPGSLLFFALQHMRQPLFRQVLGKR